MAWSTRVRGPNEGISITEALMGAQRHNGPVVDMPGRYLTPMVLSEEFSERLRVSAESVATHDREFGFMVMRGPYTAPGAIQTAFSEIGSGESRNTTDMSAIAINMLSTLLAKDVNNALFPLVTVHFHTDPGVIIPSDQDLKLAAQAVAAFSAPVINIIAMLKGPGEGGGIKMLAFQEPVSGSPILVEDPSVKDMEAMLKEENLNVPMGLTLMLYRAEWEHASQKHVLQALQFYRYKTMLLSADGRGRISESDADSFGRLFAYEPYDRPPGSA